MDHSQSDMNISALRRLDPLFERLIQNAGHVALYTFNTVGNFWEKTEIEGALFVYSRTVEPFYNIFIMNRLNAQNFVEPIVEGLDLHLEDPYLLYKTFDGKIYCLWFYNVSECLKINNVLIKILEGAKEMKVKQPEGASASVDLFSMLSKAQKAYNNSSKTDEEKSKVSDDTPKSVKDFFMKASQGSHFNSGQHIQMPDLMGAVGPLPTMHPFGRQEPLNVQRNQIPTEAMRDPLKFVEHIENQRNVFPQQELPALFNHPQQHQNLNMNEPRISASSELLPKTTLDEATKNFEFLSLADSILSRPMDQRGPFGPINYNRPTSRLNQFIPTLPIMEDPAVFNAREPNSPKATDAVLMTPMMLSSKKKSNNVQEGSRMKPLTKDELLQAINYLITNDSDFVKKIHEAYVKSFDA